MGLKPNDANFSCLSFCLLRDNLFLQALAASADVAPYICGAAVSDAPLFPGETWRGTMEVDESVCGDDAVFSVVSMLSEFTFCFVVVLVLLDRVNFSL